MRREVIALEDIWQADGLVPAVIESNVAEALESEAAEPYFVMELIEGRTLHDHVLAGSGALSLSESIEIVRSIGQTLAIGHAVGTRHRDVKPRNLIVQAGLADVPTQVYVIDFGLSFNDLDEADDLTSTIENVGNRFLQLPEHQAGHEQRDARSDITMLVGVLFYCLSAQAPNILRDGDGRPPHRRGMDLPNVRDPRQKLELGHLFDQGFQYEMIHRFQSIAELFSRLDRLETPLEIVPSGDVSARAEQIAQRIRARHRGAQLAKMAGPANLAVEHVQTAGDRHPNPLGGFFQRSMSRSDVEPPEGFERLGRGIYIEVWPGFDGPRRVIFYAVGARGWMCHLFRKITNGHPNRPDFVVVDDWHRVVSVDCERDPDVDALKEEIWADHDRALCWAMDSLEREL